MYAAVTTVTRHPVSIESKHYTQSPRANVRTIVSGLGFTVSGFGFIDSSQSSISETHIP